jgi:hypothetical protein
MFAPRVVAYLNTTLAINALTAAYSDGAEDLRALWYTLHVIEAHMTPEEREQVRNRNEEPT